MNIYKKLLLAGIAVAICVSMAACGEKKQNGDDSLASPTPETVDNATPEIPEEPATPTEEPTAEPTAEPTETPASEEHLNVGVDEETGFGEFHSF